ncbi:MAG: chromosome segregation protein SMC [Xanthomonadaceae bacterium]|nr:chromosome segregation protein SMC [Xanthomonadaceae bacterium]
MRLTKIKLAGFKSFVDPTTVVLPGQLIGIVGPNGCGKSNIIDCVRWVMGESSAKHLRGESMADVIFNGSASRKPVSQASVELLFDNRDGGLGGQYAAYAEISVKRTINRDGQSAYYLNGARCRRRDIMDIFLGTGLGPRSYAIIEQGMISRVVEAKPEELRTYLEEAAGISLYKERRRETERRMRDTQENLSRLDDVREEVGKQLERLQRQAETAERYKVLKAEERILRGQLIALRMRALQEEIATLEQILRERETAVEAALARQRQVERDIETVRSQHSDGVDALNEIQGRYYAVGSEIARLEQQIAHQRELREKQADELARTVEALQELEQSIAGDRGRLVELERRLAELEPELELVRDREDEAAAALDEAQEALDAWQQEWEEFNRAAAEPARTAQVEKARIEQLERRGQELLWRQERLQRAQDEVDLPTLEEEIAQLSANETEWRDQLALLDAQLEELQQRYDELRDQQDERRGELDDLRGELQALQGRLASLETLQHAALGQDDGPLTRWLQERGWDGRERLAQCLEVEPGWERAVEVLLGQALQAVVVDDLAAAEAVLEQLPNGTVTVLADQAPSTPPESPELLLSKVRGQGPLAELLAGVNCAQDLAAAQRLRARLAPGESVVTPDGLWLGRGWARMHAADGDGGVLVREREITALRERAALLQETIEAAEHALEGIAAALQDCEDQRDERQEERNEQARRLASLQARLEARQSRLEELRRRRLQIDEELAELAQEIRQGEEEVRQARERLQAALERGARLEEARERLQEARTELTARLDECRHRLQAERDRRHELALQQESAATTKRALEEALQRMQQQLQRASARRQELEAQLKELEAPGEDLERQRETLLQERLEVEAALASARAAQAECEQRLRELDLGRLEAERKVQALREELESGRLKLQELKVRRQAEHERLLELGLDGDQLLAQLPAEASEAEWQQRLEQLQARIARLGPINLAAIDECQALQERATYLERQYAALTEALATLEAAIRKIDRETRQRFKETYDKVNAGMRRIFPRLFGGGEGYLELTGDDLLETGVTIMARPPGKRITNIHLLSGGEKALTAVALVFAIFELNPSPFCMLDEVDAPLDEANVGRFCDLLVEMSSRVQFIFITHNKTTMQIADHLQGVTMHEPGVSRLVSVDVNDAIRLASA